MNIQDTLNAGIQSGVQIAVDVSWINILVITGVLFVSWFLSKHYIGRIVDGLIRTHKYATAKERRQRHDTLTSVFKTAIAVILFTAGVILVLSELGFDFTTLVASAGVIGVVAGFAGQSLIKDFIKGTSIIMYNQMRVGDIVTIAGFSGVVEALSIRFTRIRDLNGNVHIVPNSEITVVTNQSLGYANVNLDVGVSYDSDINKVERVINQVGLSMDGEEAWKDVVTEPIQFLRVDSFGESAVNIKALGRVLPGEQWTVAGEFRRRLKVAFENEDIVIPYPQHVIHTAPQTERHKKKTT